MTATLLAIVPLAMNESSKTNVVGKFAEIDPLKVTEPEITKTPPPSSRTGPLKIQLDAANSATPPEPENVESPETITLRAELNGAENVAFPEKI